MPTPADLFLSPDLTEEDARAYLGSLGFRDPVSVDRHLQAMAEDIVVRETLGRIAGDLLSALIESPAPDAAVAGLARYLAARTGRSMFLEYLGEDPRAMHVITHALGVSPFLREILVRNPEYFHWLVTQVERSAPDRVDLAEEIEAMLAGIGDPAEALDTLKRWHRREMLRIATRDLLRRETAPTAAAQISDVAGVTVECALAIVTMQLLAAESREAPPGTFAVVALGRLGGRELSYGAAIDLICVFDAVDPDLPSARRFFQRLCRTLTAALGDQTAEGDLYQVCGALANSLDEYDEYYTSSRGASERWSLVKARPIAGDAELGRRFVNRVEPLVYLEHPDPTALADESGVNADLAGVREIERFTQVLQLAHGGRHPALRQPGTLAALDTLVRVGLVPESVRHELAHAYMFLREVEHRLELVQESRARARSLGLGSPEDLEKQLGAYRDRVHEICRGLFEHREGARTPWP